MSLECGQSMIGFQHILQWFIGQWEDDQISEIGIFSFDICSLR